MFRFLSDYDNFPDFMRNVIHVEPKADGRSHWKVRGPAGTTVEWEAVNTRVEQNQLIEWSTIEGSPVTHSGSIRIEPFDEGSRVHVRMTYKPPAGVLGHAFALARMQRQGLRSAVRKHLRGGDDLLTADFLMQFTDNDYNGEKQIRQALKAPQKFTSTLLILGLDSRISRAMCALV